MLQSALYGRAKDLCMTIEDSVIQSDGGADAIVKVLHKRDSLSAVGSVYHDFLGLLSCKRGHSKDFRNFESRFAAQISKFNAHASSCVLPEAMTALMFLANSAIDNNQLISVLAAAAPNESNLGDTPTTDDYLKAVKYESVSSVLRQCDKGKIFEARMSQVSIAAASGHVPTSYGHVKKPKRTLNPEQLADLKMRCTCRSCGKKGHWAADNNADGSLKPGVRSHDVDSIRLRNLR